MGAQIVTVVDAREADDRVEELVAGFRAMVEADQPDGILHSELLRGQEGEWRIHTTWRDMESLIALRKAGAPPAALTLLDSVGAEHSHAWLAVEESREWS